jgi:hypothetical protein
VFAILAVHMQKVKKLPKRFTYWQFFNDLWAWLAVLKMPLDVPLDTIATQSLGANGYSGRTATRGERGLYRIV